MGLSAPSDTVILLLQSSRYNPGQLRAWAASPSSSTFLTGCIITHRPSQDAEPCRIQGLAQPPPSARPAPAPCPASTDRPAAAMSPQPHSCHLRSFRVRRRAGPRACRIRSRPIAGPGAGAALRLPGQGRVGHRQRRRRHPHRRHHRHYRHHPHRRHRHGERGHGPGGQRWRLRGTEPLRAAGGARPAPPGPWLRGPCGAAGVF